jgi:hypothetical protein
MYDDTGSNAMGSVEHVHRIVLFVNETSTTLPNLLPR